MTDRKPSTISSPPAVAIAALGAEGLDRVSHLALNVVSDLYFLSQGVRWDFPPPLFDSESIDDILFVACGIIGAFFGGYVAARLRPSASLVSAAGAGGFVAVIWLAALWHNSLLMHWNLWIRILLAAPIALAGGVFARERKP
jgi:putative membrane protein (TIGR04086 family)